ncbi:hypothetical protein ES708_26807 [subsurface metagenome]
MQEIRTSGSMGVLVSNHPALPDDNVCLSG